jgi:hypothetical protein
MIKGQESSPPSEDWSPGDNQNSRLIISFAGLLQAQNCGRLARMWEKRAGELKIQIEF